MLRFLQHLFEADFLPHGHCYFWRPGIVWLHVISDGMIALAYFSIPLTLRYFVKKRGDVPYIWIFRLFAAFIFACGCTHVLNIVTLWYPMYRFDGIVKLYTGLISVATAVLLIPIIPQALSLPSIKLANQTLKRLTGELQRSNADLQHFAMVASHDLREPLQTISGYVGLLKRRYAGQLDEKALRFLDRSLEAVERMDLLIHDLLDYARIDTRGMPFQATDLNVVLQSTQRDLAQAIEGAQARLVVDKLPNVMVDESQIKQVFQNLLSNAIKYRGIRPLEIQVTAQRQQDGWEISVRDNGIGIAPEHFADIFVMFKRLQGQSEIPGSGIGLAVCKKIIERRGGTIGVSSTLGEGAVFSFTIPDALPQNDAASLGSAQSDDANPAQSFQPGA